MTTETEAMDVLANDDFDLLLNDVLRTVANPEVPARVRVQTRVWVREMTSGPASAHSAAEHATHTPARTAAVFAPDVFLARMQPKRDARSTAYAVMMHAAAILLICWVVSAHVGVTPTKPTAELNVLTTPPPLVLEKLHSGGGGGSNDHAPVAKGQLPKFAPVQITPPKIPVEARIKMPDPALEAVTDLKMVNPSMPNLGMPTSNTLGASLGSGSGTGMGPGKGPGLGAGIGGNFGGGMVKQVGHGVSMPEVRVKVQPEFSEEARRMKHQGNVWVSIIVDTNGIPQSVHVIQGLGMGLDENAVEAVKQYRFKPAMENGKPVAVYMNVEVIFQIE